ncbi:MAG TPA: nucleotidyl transferase AbiEii/AbiGii toxin family protein [Planctomycetota bacterium]|nr:nucleotidyl transferase AbiEii/AbiGii toxin family protein [Planctomycetota bacterium]
MIPRDYITEWRAHAPWADDAQVELDLVISRALVELFADPVLAERLAFRGGTALHKLFLLPPARYSEDIDLVQVRPAPIGADLDRMRSVLGTWLEETRWKHGDGGVTLNWRFDSEDEPSRPVRLKIEINTREHGTRLGYHFEELAVASRWFTRRARIRTFQLDELMGTKLRALYQRRKGRDLFDLVRALDDPRASPERIVAVCVDCMAAGGTPITRAAMAANLATKRSHPLFRADLSPLLAAGATFDVDSALDRVMEELVARLPSR